MRKIEFWADGCLSYHGWRGLCTRCGGRAHPLKKPDPDFNCTLCYGMGSSPGELAPVAIIEESTLSEIEDLSQYWMGCSKLDPLALKKVLAVASSSLRERPESEDSMYALAELERVADFAQDIGTNVVWGLA